MNLGPSFLYTPHNPDSLGTRVALGGPLHAGSRPGALECGSGPTFNNRLVLDFISGLLLA